MEFLRLEKNKQLQFFFTQFLSSNWIKLLNRFGSVRCAKLSVRRESAKVPKGFVLKRKNISCKIFFLRFVAVLASGWKVQNSSTHENYANRFKRKFFVVCQWFTLSAHMRKYSWVKDFHNLLTKFSLNDSRLKLSSTYDHMNLYCVSYSIDTNLIPFNSIQSSGRSTLSDWHEIY